MSPWASRILALALFAAAATAAIGGAVWGYAALERAQAEAIAEAENRLERLARVNARRTALEAELAMLRTRQGLPRVVFEESSVELASAALQTRTKRLAEQSGCEIASTQVLGTRAEKPFQRFGLQVRMAGDVAALQRLLHLLAAERPLVVVDAIAVIAKPDATGTADPRYAPVPLTWTINVHAYRRPA